MVWEDFPLRTISAFERRLYVLKHRELTHYEEATCITVQEHQSVILLAIQGHTEDRRTGRTVGYGLMYQGAPFIHRYLHCVGLAYSGATDIRFREGRVLHDDEFVRLWCMGVGTFDYLFINRKIPAFMKPKSGVILTGDGAAHSRYAGSWNEGI